MTLTVEPIALLRDNYAYLVTDAASGRSAIVDPSETKPVLARIEARGARITAIWCTHHHFDHVGGVEGVVAALGSVEVLGSRHDERERRIPRQTRAVGDGDVVTLGETRLEILEIPGHTLGAIAWVGAGHAFTGDTLFSAGCGRVFEGTMPMMRASLARLAALDGTTRVWSGHEYTVRNLEFARVVEPSSPSVERRLEASRTIRERSEPTVGGTIDEERATNPFLRWSETAVRAFAATRGDASTDDAVFARVREAKDAF